MESGLTLINDVTFDSLSAIQAELRQWFGADAEVGKASSQVVRARDALVSVLIHNLAEELSDVRVRSQIQALLSDLNKQAGKRLAH